ncbi:thioesterase [Helicobacter sp. 16-1353]|uniref:PaaI family thioesterase n=1 Tax=Helicobacter sp. 16-1353 TaxID=2004996 RepID=UPI000DCE9352|nr:PaaI family thioesterase [Helicobacter sp. 16-1353]RAX53813.1 thioesterase [Helicobacter sp. 16-1353]
MEDEEILDENLDDIRIYKKINKDLCGEIIKLSKNEAMVKFIPTEKMVVDDSMLIHYGFIFSSASFCAMAAVNHPNSMIIYAETKFLSPVELNSEIIFKAKALQSDLKKREVVVEGFLYNIKIFDAVFHIVVFDKNIFKIDFKSIK